MSSSCCFQHSPIIDASTATIVCENCARVLEEGLTHFEVNPQKYYIPGENLKEERKEEKKINGENPIKLLEKISAKLHLHKSSIDIAYHEYYKNRKKIDKSLTRKPLFLSPENVLIYSIYTALKKDSCPRSIKEICNIAVLKDRSILKIGTFLEKIRDEDTPSTRLKPINAKDIILTHYQYITDLSFEDVKQMFHKLNTLGPISFTPSTTAAGVVYLYTNTAEHKKQTLQQVSSLFKVTPMSIQRFVKKYNTFFF
jgi:transcription initiation factor TFIIIB Brf1 subunit/transcription initiation factor TFIIB